MPLVIADRVLETSTTTGTGTLTLAGAVSGFQTFSSAIGNTNTTYYTITLDSAGEWEVGIGTVGAGTLTRTTVLASSNAGSLVNFSAGSKQVFATYPASRAAYAQSDNASWLFGYTATPAGWGSYGVVGINGTSGGGLSFGVAGTETGTVLTDTNSLVFKHTTGSLRFVTGSTDRLTINASGAFGVGSTPTYGTSGQALLSSGNAAVPAWTTIPLLSANNTWTDTNTFQNTVSVLGTATIAPLRMTAGSVKLTTALAGAFEYDDTVAYFTPFGTSRGTLPAEQYVVLNTAYTLTSQTGAQRLFNASANGAVAITPGTYAFECVYALSNMSTGTSASFGFAFGGTATITQRWTALAQKSAALGTAATGQITFNTAANTALTSNSTTATGQAVIRGTINCTVAGTLIPQVSLGAAAAASVNVGSYFRIYPISPTNSTTNVTVGNWT